MKDTLDARGLSCPLPVLMIRDAIRKCKTAGLEILVDSETSKENILRSVSGLGWNLDAIEQDGDVYRIIISKD